MSKLIEPAGRSFIHCGKCRTDIVLPTNLSAQEAAKFAVIVRNDSVEGVRYAEKNLGLGSKEAKALTLHVTRSPGSCHKCGKPVVKEESVCTCRSVNLDW